jgi:hypothetical protein
LAAAAAMSSKVSLVSGYQTLLLYTKLSSGSCHTVLYHDNGQFYGFGTGKHGELGNKQGFVKFAPAELDLGIKVPGGSKRPIRVACGFEHTIVLVDGRVYSFGSTEHGRLGRDESEIQIEFPNDDLIGFIGNILASHN